MVEPGPWSQAEGLAFLGHSALCLSTGAGSMVQELGGGQVNGSSLAAQLRVRHGVPSLQGLPLPIPCPPPPFSPPSHPPSLPPFFPFSLLALGSKYSFNMPSGVSSPQGGWACSEGPLGPEEDGEDASPLQSNALPLSWNPGSPLLCAGDPRGRLWLPPPAFWGRPGSPSHGVLEEPAW